MGNQVETPGHPFEAPGSHVETVWETTLNHLEPPLNPLECIVISGCIAIIAITMITIAITPIAIITIAIIIFAIIFCLAIHRFQLTYAIRISPATHPLSAFTADISQNALSHLRVQTQYSNYEPHIHCPYEWNALRPCTSAYTRTRASVFSAALHSIGMRPCILPATVHKEAHRSPSFRAA